MLPAEQESCRVQARPRRPLGPHGRRDGLPGGFDSGSGPKIANACVIKADNPHLSKTAERQSRRDIVSKGWFNCSTGLQDATLRVEIQQQKNGSWDYESGDQEDWGPVRPRTKYQLAVELGCVEGRFRTAVRMTAHDQTGRYLQSQWYYSRVVTDPCAGG